MKTKVLLLLVVITIVLAEYEYAEYIRHTQKLYYDNERLRELEIENERRRAETGSAAMPGAAGCAAMSEGETYQDDTPYQITENYPDIPRY
nr:E-rich short acidic peptide [Pseudoips prasinana]